MLARKEKPNMTPNEKGAILCMLRTIATTLANMSSTESNFTRAANLQELEIAINYCIDTFESCD